MLQRGLYVYSYVVEKFISLLFCCGEVYTFALML